MPRRRRSRTMSSSRSRSRTPKRTRNASTGDRNLRDAALGGDDQRGRKRKVNAHILNEENKALKTLTSKTKSLEPKEIDLHIESNRKAHHTDEYEHTNLLVRRGQAFYISVEFNRAYNHKDDVVTIQFVTGSRPQQSKGTLLRLEVIDDAPCDIERWHAQYSESTGSKLTIAITPAAEAIIGKYSVFVETGKLGSNQTRKDFEDEIVLLFNPWCKDDAVYMDKSADLEEYVLNETGRIWMGTESSFEPMAWNFSQFDDVCLDAALFLLDKSELAQTARSNPVHVVRTMSAMSNSNDADGGVLTGRWTDTYPKNCTEPWAWTGSSAILEKFMKGKKAVRYGQCWVFSGLVTTLCRTLGVPTRSVTNFESAHDYDASMTIDCHWDEKDDPMEDLNDSIWNFHVWNESYFQRPDLPEGYGGWQAHDSTPQELSEGVMRCGPVSVKAVKEGHVYLPYDTPFMFAEVNGDKVHWLVKEDGSMEVLAKEEHAIGKRISTKSVKSNRRDDITSNYKHREGSQAERIAVKRAFQLSSRKEHAVYDVPKPDVTFELITPPHVAIGDDFTIEVKMTNTSKEKRHVSVNVLATMMYYTGVPSERIAKEVFKDEIRPKGVLVRELHVSSEAYMDELKPESCIQACMRATVLDNHRCTCHMANFMLAKPAIMIKMPKRVSLGDEFDIAISFTNPLKVKLTGVEFHIDGAGIIRDKVIRHKAGVNPGTEVTANLTVKPKRAGTKELLVRMSSNELTGVTGTGEVYISYAY